MQLFKPVRSGIVHFNSLSSPLSEELRFCFALL